MSSLGPSSPLLFKDALHGQSLASPGITRRKHWLRLESTMWSRVPRVVV
jgi:hypothetical protein